MAESSGAGDVSLDTSSEEEYVGFSAKDVEITETRIRDQSGWVSDDEVDVSDFEDSDIASSDGDETETEVAGTEVANVPEQQWSNRFDDQPDIVFVDKARGQ